MTTAKQPAIQPAAAQSSSEAVGTMAAAPTVTAAPVTPTASNWVIAYVFSNFATVTPFESEFLAIVPASDPRVAAFAMRFPAAKSLISNFTDPYGRPKKVCVLIARDDAPNERKTRQSIIGFRDMFAISSLTFGCQMALTESTGWDLIFTTYFDLYPISLSSDVRDLVTISPAGRGLDDAEKFRGQVSPYIISTSLLRPQPDEMLVGRLQPEWDHHVKAKTKTKKHEALFRSMEVAYQAASLPLISSAYEYGARVALWVSA